jgi:hypothetical protein
MAETTRQLVPAPADSLHAELRAPIASSRQRRAGAVNAELTRLYWAVGERLRTEVLGGVDRAKYGDQLIKCVGDQLAQEFGCGFESKKLRLTADEKTEVVANCDHLQNLKFSKALPFAPSPAANRWNFCKYTKTATAWPSTGPNCHPKRSWSKSCMRLCLKRVSGWRGAGCCWETWMMSDDVTGGEGLWVPVVALPGVVHTPAKGEDEQEAARVFFVALTRATQRLVIGVDGSNEVGKKLQK